MMTLTNQQIKEISEQLDCGFKAFWHKETEELVFIPDTLRHYDMDLEAWEEDIEKVESDYYAYFEFTPLSSRDSFEIMVDFVDTLSDSNALKKRLIYALEHN